MDNGRFHSRLYVPQSLLLIKKDRGFTMIELMVAMSIASVVAMSGFALFSQSNWSYQVQENVGEAQQNARVAIDRISRDIRTAGFGLPEPPYSIDFPYGGGTISFDSPITVSDSSAGPDSITVLGIGYEVGTLAGGTDENRKADDSICYSKTTTQEKLIVTDGANSTVHESRRYVSIDGVFFAELDTATQSVACTGGRTLPLDDPSILKGDFDSGTVYIIQAVEYSIAEDITGCSATNPCLVSKDYSQLRGANFGNVSRQLLAENIEDIQFAYGLDKQPDGEIDCTGAYTSECFKAPLLSTDSESNIRAIRLTLSARTRNRDTKGATFRRPEIENHPQSDLDNYRRRILTKIVKLRN